MKRAIWRCAGHSLRFPPLAVAFASVLVSSLPAAPATCPAIAAGSGHSLALKDDGSVWAWGDNGIGELGDGTYINSSLPVQVKDPPGTGLLTGVTAIAAGDSHSLALKGDGSVWAWGRNYGGQLGNGTTTSSGLPLQVKDATGSGFLSGVAAIASGSDHSLAVKRDGSLWAWGYNLFGQLGNGMTTNSSLPVRVKDPTGSGFLAGVTAIGGGRFHSLALKGDGTVWAWGESVWGQLGNGTYDNSSLPVRVLDAPGTGFLTGVSAIAAGWFHSLALKRNGSVWAWGNNIKGQLGAWSTVYSRLPVQVKDPTGTGFFAGIVTIAAGSEQSMAVKGDGSVWAWGSNMWGQLGNGKLGDQSNSPVHVKDAPGTGFLTGVTTVAAGYQHALALMGDGSVWAWGYNLYGELGNGTNTDSTLPVQSSINLGPSVPPDQGNVLFAVKRGTDVVLTWTATGTTSWGVYRDPAKDQLGRTLVPPAVSVAPAFVDADRLSVAGDDYYRIKGLSACGAGL